MRPERCAGYERVGWRALWGGADELSQGEKACLMQRAAGAPFIVPAFGTVLQVIDDHQTEQGAPAYPARSFSICAVDVQQIGQRLEAQGIRDAFTVQCDQSARHLVPASSQ